MKRRTRAQKFGDYADAVKAINEGKKVKRSGTKDGSIATHPVVPVVADRLEKDILRDCLIWLKTKRLICNRNNVGAGQILDATGVGNIYNYGIKNAGDIVGLLRNGRHFEIETKRGKGGRLSMGQQKRMQLIRGSNGLYFVVHGVEELEYYFKDLV